MEEFLSAVCTPQWNAQQDAGRPIAEAVAERTALFPDRADLIAAFYERWEEMLNGAVGGTVEIVHALKDRGTPLYALTNWSAETFPKAVAIFDFLGAFEDILVSGREEMIKPDPAIYRRLLDRNGLRAPDCLFVDDSKKNVEGAKAVGMQAVHFQSPAQLRLDLENLSLL
jgi:2-haloacid dehalogenase